MDVLEAAATHKSMSVVKHKTMPKKEEDLELKLIVFHYVAEVHSNL
jgi:hypothetical protein